MNYLPISSLQIKVFLGTFIAMFVMTALQHMGVRLPFPISFEKHAATASLQKNIKKTDTLDIYKEKDMAEVKSISKIQ